MLSTRCSAQIQKTAPYQPEKKISSTWPKPSTGPMTYAEPSGRKVLLMHQEGPLFLLHNAFVRINAFSPRHEVYC